MNFAAVFAHTSDVASGTAVNDYAVVVVCATVAVVGE